MTKGMASTPSISNVILLDGHDLGMDRRPLKLTHLWLKYLEDEELVNGCYLACRRVISYHGTGSTIWSPGSAKAITTATNAILQPAVKTISSGVISTRFPYTARISWAREDLAEGSPETAVYAHVDSEDPWAAMASRRNLGGGMSGTPWDMSISGWVGVGW